MATIKVGRRERAIKCEICSIRSCRNNKEKRMFMAKFPLDGSRCKEWVKVVGKEDLAYVPIEKLHALKYVCGNHFEPKHYNRKKSRLRKTAVPSKNLTSDPLPDDMLKDFPSHIACDLEDKLSLIQMVQTVAVSNTSGSHKLEHQSTIKCIRKIVPTRKRVVAHKGKFDFVLIHKQIYLSKSVRL